MAKMTCREGKLEAIWCCVRGGGLKRPDNERKFTSWGRRTCGTYIGQSTRLCTTEKNPTRNLRNNVATALEQSKLNEKR